jgi:hypothetical protein
MSSYPPAGYVIKPNDRAYNLYGVRRGYLAATNSVFEEATLNYYTGGANSIDMWNAVPWYGKVTPNNFLVVPDEHHMQYSFSTSRLGALPWVYEAVSDLQSYFNRAAVHGRSDLNKLFHGFDVVKSYESPYQEYLRYAAQILVEFQRTLISRNRKIVSNFKDYLKAFVRHLESLEKPFTFANYFASNRVSAHSTGLVVAFADFNANDPRHATRYFVNNEFKKYAQGAANFGFRVDQNAPWRLVADMASKPMEKYLIRQNIPNITEAFKKFYSPAILYDLVATRNLLVEAYTAYQSNREYSVIYKTLSVPNFETKSAWATNVRAQMQYPVTLEPLTSATLAADYTLFSFLPIFEEIKKADRKPPHRRDHKVFKAKFNKLLRQKQMAKAIRALDRFHSLR